MSSIFERFRKLISEGAMAADASATGGSVASTADALEKRAKRKGAEARAAATDWANVQKRIKAGDPPSRGFVANPVTGETWEQRAKRKADEAAEAAQVAAKARKEQQKQSERPKQAQSAFSLYDDLPEPDPEKDAEAARRAEEQVKRNDVPKITYVEDRSKVVFLDIDGVLRPVYGDSFQMATINMDGENVPLVDPQTEFISSAMSALRVVLEQTGAALVLSSEWRRHPALRDGVLSNLKRKGLPPPIDDTPPFERDLTGNPLRSFAIRRAREIGAWLKAHPEVRQWVALDDIDLGQADEVRQEGQVLMTPRLVLTEKSTCLTLEDAKEAINILSGQLRKGRYLDVPG